MGKVYRHLSLMVVDLIAFELGERLLYIEKFWATCTTQLKWPLYIQTDSGGRGTDDEHERPTKEQFWSASSG